MHFYFVLRSVCCVCINSSCPKNRVIELYVLLSLFIYNTIIETCVYDVGDDDAFIIRTIEVLVLLFPLLIIQLYFLIIFGFLFFPF